MKRNKQFLNERMSAKKTSLGLLCSFAKEDNLACHSYSSLKKVIDKVCREFDFELKMVEKNNSLDWMEEVMKVIMLSHFVLIDVTHPRQNVIYELGIACSIRNDDSVIILNKNCNIFKASEVLQLQMLRYETYDDLYSGLRKHLKNVIPRMNSEANYMFPDLHKLLSPEAMYKLYRMAESRIDYGKKGHDAWPISFNPKSPRFPHDVSYSLELVSQGLAKYDYGNCKTEGRLEWALHPTTLGKAYIQTKHFLKFFYPTNKIKEIQKSLKYIAENKS